MLLAVEKATGVTWKDEARVLSKRIKHGKGGLFTAGVVRHVVRDSAADREDVSIIAKTLAPSSTTAPQGRSPWLKWDREAYVYADINFYEEAKEVRFPRCYLIEVADENRI